MDVARMIENNAAWAAAQTRDDPDFFSRLTEGQNPTILYIGCSDSRVTAEDMMGARPGEVFVLRNIANMASALDLSAMAVVKYAVSNLGVADIVVCGHYLCGGIESAMQPRDLGMLNPWLRTIRDVYRLHEKELNAITDQAARRRRLVELNVREQCINVLKTADVQRAFRSGQVEIHGWVFDISRGRIIDLEIDVPGEIQKIAEIYRLDE